MTLINLDEAFKILLFGKKYPLTQEFYIERMRREILGILNMGWGSEYMRSLLRMQRLSRMRFEEEED